MTSMLQPTMAHGFDDQMGRPGTNIWHRIETWCLVAAVFFAPLNYFRLESLFFTVGDALAILAFCMMVANGSLNLRFFGPGTSLWMLSVVLFLTGLAVASIAKANPIEFGVVLVQYTFTLALMPMVIAGHSMSRSVLLLKTLILSVALVMVVGIYVINFVDDPSWRLVSWNGRMRSLVERSNECAMLAAIAIVLVLGLYSERILSAAWLVLLPVLLYGIVLTGSNSGLLLMAFGCFFVIVTCGSVRLLAATVVSVLLFGAVLVMFNDVLVPEIFRERVLRAFFENDVALAGNLMDRLFLYQEAVQLSENNLIIGLGVNQYQEVSAHGAHVHNAYLLALTEGGLLSLFGLIGLVFTPIFIATLVFAHTPQRRIAAISITTTLIYVFALNLFPTLYARFFLVPLILTTALAASCLLNRSGASGFAPAAHRVH